MTTQYDETDEDPLAVYDERLGRLEEHLTEREQEEAEAAYAVQVREVVDEMLDSLELDQEDQDWVLAYAINALPITEEGLPDIEQAYQVFAQRETERQRNWARTKRAPVESPRTGNPRPRLPTSTIARSARNGCSAGCRTTRPHSESGRGRNPLLQGQTEPCRRQRKAMASVLERGVDRRSTAEAVRGQEPAARAAWSRSRA